MNLIIIKATDSESDQYLCPPAGMALQEASKLLDATVAKVKLDPEYDYHTLDEALESLGFTWPMVITCEGGW